MPEGADSATVLAVDANGDVIGGEAGVKTTTTPGEPATVPNGANVDKLVFGVSFPHPDGGPSTLHTGKFKKTSLE